MSKLVDLIDDDLEGNLYLELLISSEDVDSCKLSNELSIHGQEEEFLRFAIEAFALLLHKELKDLEKFPFKRKVLEGQCSVINKFSLEVSLNILLFDRYFSKKNSVFFLFLLTLIFFFFF